MHETQEMQVQSLGREDPLEKEMATHPSILAWRVPRTEEPEGLQSMAAQRVRHDWPQQQHLKYYNENLNCNHNKQDVS